MFGKTLIMSARKTLYMLMILGVIFSTFGTAQAREINASILPGGTAQVQIDNEVFASLEQKGEARVIINLRDPVSIAAPSSERESAVARIQGSVLSRLTPQDFRVIRQYVNVPALAGHLTSSGLNVLMSDPNVASIDIDQMGAGHLSESVTALGADVVHSNGYTGQGVTVAVLDTGIDTDHLDLSDDLVAQHCFTDSQCKPGSTAEGTSAEDENGHGTNVSGIISSGGVVSSVGFAPDASIVAVRVLDANSSGWVSDWLAGLDWIRTNQGTLGVDVINMSLGTFALYSGHCDADNSSVANVVAQLNSLGIVIFASTGNQGSATQMAMPACLSGVVAVGATFDSDLGREPDSGTYQDVFGGSWPACANDTTNLQTITCFTNSNSVMDIVAPGARITASGMGGGTSTYMGTSQASPTAAGIAALMLQASPGLSPATIESTLKSTGTSVTDAKNGLSFPLINALAAVNAVNTTFTDVPSSYWAYDYIERLYAAGITSGCSASPMMYCPLAPVTRAQMAIFILRGEHGSAYTPPAATGTVFSDVTTSTFGAAWIEQFASEGITSGCGNGMYCPDANVTRAQMAIFLLRGKYGSAYVPPVATGVFTDVPVGSFAADWIEQLASEGITSGCGGGNYCPNAEVTRDQMAVFLVRTFNLP